MHRSKAVKAVTTIQGQPIKDLQAGDAYQHLGVPTGLYVNQTPEDTIKSMLQDLAAVKDSLLAPWQKLDAVRTFILPQAQFVLQTARIQKTAFQDLDKAIKSAAKQFLHLPDRASNEIIYIPCRQGGANLLPLSELADVGAVQKAFKILTSPDPLVREVGLAGVSRAAARLIGREPSHAELAAYLSGAEFRSRPNSFATVWSAARNATRRLDKKLGGLSWSWSETLQRFALEVAMPGREPNKTVVDAASRSRVSAVLRDGLQHHHLRTLTAKPDQGKVFDACSAQPASNHFLASGHLTRFCDWRFIHRARLGVLPLNGALRIPGRSRACRRCQYADETTAHVLDHCLGQGKSRAWNNRHRSVIGHLLEAMPDHVREHLRVERAVPGTDSALKPDLVLLNAGTKSAAIIDVTCPFENRRQALAVASEAKMTKYAGLQDALRQQGFTCSMGVVAVGALGTWDANNEYALSLLGIPARERRQLRPRIVSDVIRWSRNIYVEHMCGHRQYSSDVVLPELSSN
ncbi:uncharacterized protein T26G10.4-like [Thrips palmi]|uniref:Uncharacterized protein T26G10.4-like n=1 Tax=Thrips palmi TaxID=161013 RepID=A0A6P8ZQF7_THRPL|nr:uncharacterized protein T26G10.4-like [Thrips palmi]